MKNNAGTKEMQAIAKARVRESAFLPLFRARVAS